MLFLPADSVATCLGRWIATPTFTWHMNAHGAAVCARCMRLMRSIKPPALRRGVAVCVLQAFEKIQQATGIEEIDRLVDSFIGAEGQNYTL